MNDPQTRIAVIGGGPAGLRAAEIAAAGGAAVTLFDARPSAGRKFLVAGRGGLNLTRDEPLDAFISHYNEKADQTPRWPALISAFDPPAMRAWAAGPGRRDLRRLDPPGLSPGPEGRADAEALGAPVARERGRVCHGTSMGGAGARGGRRAPRFPGEWRGAEIPGRCRHPRPRRRFLAANRLQRRVDRNHGTPRYRRCAAGARQLRMGMRMGARPSWPFAKASPSRTSPYPPAAWSPTGSCW